MYRTTYTTTAKAASSSASMGTGAAVWIIISFILAIIGGILAYYLFVKPEKKYDNKFLTWLKEFLSFDKMLIEGILKVLYIILAIFITLCSFSCFSAGGIGVLLFFVVLILGNVIVRVAYEAALIKIMIWKNTTEIKKAVKKTSKDEK